MARPATFKTEFIGQAYKLALLGLTDDQMAGFFGITKQTFNNWKKSQPEFFDSIKKGKELADGQVVQALFKRATGYKNLPPDTMACIYWLNNRQRNKWAQKPSGNGDDDPPPPTKVEILVKDARRPEQQ